MQVINSDVAMCVLMLMSTTGCTIKQQQVMGLEQHVEKICHRCCCVCWMRVSLISHAAVVMCDVLTYMLSWCGVCGILVMCVERDGAVIKNKFDPSSTRVVCVG